MTQNAPTKLLIVDDEPDLREVITMVIASVVKAEFIEAGSAKEAIALIEGGTRFEGVICDFNMPNGNGGTFAKYLQDKGFSLPFLLLSSDERSKHEDLLKISKRSYLQKPFRNEDLRNQVEQMLKALEGVQVEEQEYIPVSLMTLQRVSNISRPLYIQIGENKFVKVVNPGGYFSNEEVDRFTKKNVGHLFVHKDDIGPLLHEYRENVFTEMYFQSLKEKQTEALNLSKSTLELIQVAAKSMNWSPEIISLGNENVKMMQNLVAESPDINNVFDWFSHGEHDLGVSTGILLSYFLASLTKEMGITNKRHLEILSMAGFFHDMLLDDYQIRNQEKFIKAMMLGASTNRDAVEQIKHHPMGAREILSKWGQCPSGLLEIIEQHHEVPDGSGFPKGLKGAQIHPLSGIFIVACEAIEVFVRTKDKSAVKDHLRSRAEVFKQVPTEHAYETAIKLF